jgi:hypothetical protein
MARVLRTVTLSWLAAGSLVDLPRVPR